MYPGDEGGEEEFSSIDASDRPDDAAHLVEAPPSLVPDEAGPPAVRVPDDTAQRDIADELSKSGGAVASPPEEGSTTVGGLHDPNEPERFADDPRPPHERLEDELQRDDGVANPLDQSQGIPDEPAEDGQARLRDPPPGVEPPGSSGEVASPAANGSVLPPAVADGVRAPLGVPPLRSGRTEPLSDERPLDAAAPPDGLASGPERAAPPPVAARSLPRILAVANQKGGVGKTTTAVNLGAALAELGYRVLIVDLDPQGNATTGLDISVRNLQCSIYDVLTAGTPIEDCIEPTSLRNLFVAPATIDLAGAEIELVPAFSRELRLRRALEGLENDFDFTLIDCPPSLGLLTVNGLAAAGEVCVPIQCEYYALEGLGQLIRNVSLVQTNLNPRLEVSTIILTMYDARTRLSEQVAKEVREHFGDKVCRRVVPRTVRLSEAPSFGQPIIVFDPTSRGALAYRDLAKEVSGGAPQRVG